MTTEATKKFTHECEKGVHGKFNACMYRDQCRSKDEEIKKLRAALAALLACPSGMYCDAYQEAEKQARALL